MKIKSWHTFLHLLYHPEILKGPKCVKATVTVVNVSTSFQETLRIIYPLYCRYHCHWLHLPSSIRLIESLPVIPGTLLCMKVYSTKHFWDRLLDEAMHTELLSTLWNIWLCKHARTSRLQLNFCLMLNISWFWSFYIIISYEYDRSSCLLCNQTDYSATMCPSQPSSGHTED